MLTIEVLKIFKRKFNYIYLVITLGLLLGIQYVQNTMYNDIGISKEEYLYTYNMKLLLVFSILFAIINTIFSYRKDYSEGLAELIRYSKISGFYNLFTKFIINYFVAVVYYVTLVGIYGVFLYYITKIDKSLLFSDTMKNNILLSLTLLLYATSIALLVIVIFNSVHVAFPLSVLLLTILTFVREFIKEKYALQLPGDIFSDSFVKVSEKLVLDMSDIYQLLIYTICIFLIALFVKLLKNN